MYQQEPTLGKINTEDMKPKSFEMLVFSTLKCQNLSLEFPRKVKCNILPNEPLVHCCCSLLGLIQILLNNHKFHKCETSAQNCSVLFTNQHVSFLKKIHNPQNISSPHNPFIPFISSCSDRSSQQATAHVCKDVCLSSSSVFKKLRMV